MSSIGIVAASAGGVETLRIGLVEPLINDGHQVAIAHHRAGDGQTAHSSASLGRTSSAAAITAAVSTARITEAAMAMP